MFIQFQQGIITHPVSGSQQTFLRQRGTVVDLVAVNGRIEVAICHGNENYRHIESNDVPAAWGPVDNTTTYWLYIDIDRKTAVRTFGLTTVAPTFSNVRPSNPANDHHWFNTTNTKMYVYKLGDYREVVRVFFAKLQSGQFYSLGTGQGNQSFAGTQVGLQGVPVRHGIIFSDGNGKPVQKDDGTFFTSESAFFINGSQVNSVRLETTIQNATATQPVALFQIAKFSGFGEVEPATFNDLQNTVLVMCLENVTTGQPVQLAAQGLITNVDWNWSTAGAPLWIDDTGSLTEVNLHVTDPQNHPLNKAPLAYVIAQDQILFDQTTTTTSEQQTSVTVSTSTTAQLGVSRLSLAAIDSTNPIVVGDNDPRMSDARTPLPHTHIAGTIAATSTGTRSTLNVQGQLDELDASKLALAGGTMVGVLTLSGDPVNTLDAATKAYVDVKASRQPFQNTSGSQYTLSTADIGNVIRHTNSTAVSIHIPLNVDMPAVAGDVIMVRQVGSGQLSLVPEVGVIINTPAGFQPKTGRLGSVISIHYVGGDVWDLTGDFQAV